MDEQENIRTPSKFCKHCGVEHPLTKEYWYRLKKYPICKVRQSQINGKYYKNNKQSIGTRNNLWREANPEKVKEYSKKASNKWKKANPEKAREKLYKWREANPEKVSEYNKKWRKANPDKIKELEIKWRKINPNKLKEYSKKAILNLTDSYVAECLEISVSELSPEIIETKRSIIKINRLVKQLKKQENGN